MMAKTFSRNSVAYDDAATLHAINQPIRQNKLKVTGGKLEILTGVGEAGEDIAPQVGVDDRVFLGRGRTTGDAYRSGDGQTWTRLNLTSDLWQLLGYDLDTSDGSSQLDAIAVLSVGGDRELHRLSDIMGTPTLTRTKLGGSSATAGNHYLDRESNTLAVNSGTTPTADGASLGASGLLYEDGPILSAGTDFTISIKAKVPDLSATGSVFHLRPDTGQDGRLELTIASATGSAVLRVGSNGTAIVLPGTYDDDVRRRYDVTGTRSGGTIEVKLEIYDDAGVLIDSGTASGLTWEPEAASDFIVGSTTTASFNPLVNGVVSDLSITAAGTLIRDYLLNQDTAVEDGTLPGNARIQVHGHQPYYNGDGTLAAVAFGYYHNPAPSIDTYLYRTTDGIHYERTHTHVDTATQNNHTHAIIGNYAFFGDTANSAVIRTEDQGRTWLPVYGPRPRQPIGGQFEPGSDTIMRSGGDSEMGMGRWDWTDPDDAVVTEYDSGIPTWMRGKTSSENRNRYVWPFRPAGGYWYWSHSPVQYEDRSCVGVAGDGLDSPVTIWHPPNGFRGVKYFTRVGGVLVGTLEDSANAGPQDASLLRIELPSIQPVSTVRVGPAATNLMSEDASLCQTVAGADSPQGSVTPVLGSNPLFGSNSIEAERSASGALTLRLEAESLANTDTVCGIVFAKGVSLNGQIIGIHDAVAGANIADAQARVILPETQWLEVTLPADDAANTGDHRIKLLHQVELFSGTKKMIVGGAALYANVPVTPDWTPGGTPLAAASMSETAPRGLLWADEITVWPRRSTEEANGKVYLFTWSAGDSRVSVVWTGSVIAVESVIDGGSPTTDATTFDYFYKNTQITARIVVDASFASFVGAQVFRGMEVQSFILNPALVPDLTSTDVTFTTGDESGENAWPMSVENAGASGGTLQQLNYGVGLGIGLGL